MHKNIQILLIILALCSFNVPLTSSENDGNRYTNVSLLSQGDWYKIKVANTGIYKLTYEDLVNMGLKNPGNAQIYGYGGEMLEEDFKKPYIDDLPQISIWMNTSPENFGVGDYILFYAKGSTKWALNNLLGEFLPVSNPYSTEAFYFVTERLENQNLAKTIVPQNNATTYATTFDDYLLYEKDSVNLIRSGRKFFGENFNVNRDRTFHFELPNAEGIARIRYEFVARPSKNPAVLSAYLNGSLSKRTTFDTVSVNDKYLRAIAKSDYFIRTLYNGNLEFKLNYTPGSVEDINAYLDYISINYRRLLKPYGAFTLFRDRSASSNHGFQIQEVNESTMILDITDDTNIKVLDIQKNGTQLKFSAPNNPMRQYAMVDLSQDFARPTFVNKIDNQNLHGLPNADILIITSPLLKEYAEQLAALHLLHDNMDSHVVTTEMIYNEFSSGNIDATAIRRFVKMFYDRAQTNEGLKKTGYLILFGDGTYDNRFLTDEWLRADKNVILPTFQSVNSLAETASYVTDDYFGFLDDKEGSKLGNAGLDIAIGRIPVRNGDIAQGVVNKIERYITNHDRGIWQNTITFVADDAVADSNPATAEMDHITNTDKYTETIKAAHPDVIINKIYEDAYERKSTTGWNYYPDARKALLNSVNDGTLVLQYMGHGSPFDWTHEYIIRLGDVEKMENKVLPLWITASCDFSRFDVPNISGGEMAILNPRGGAIGLYSTSRLVYSSNNDIMAQSIFAHLFDQENNSSLRFGDIMRRAKNEPLLSTDENKLRFMLLGDPVLKLNYPDKTYKVKVTSINGSSSEVSDIKLKALSEVTINGEIQNHLGELANNFNGMLETVIFDNEQDLKTRGYVAPGQSFNTVFQYKDYLNSIYRGKVLIEGGKFSITFTVPSEILYSGTNGKMGFYAYSNDNKEEAGGYFTQYTVTRSDTELITEKNPPVIDKMYLNDESFVSGDTVEVNPTLIAYLSDDTGINLSSSLGHNLSLSIDDNIEYDIASSFISSVTEGNKSGYLKFSIPRLLVGKHTLQLKVWDIHKNSQTKSLSFTIGEKYRLKYHVGLDREISKESIRFVFDTNANAEDKIALRYEIYAQDNVLKWIYNQNGNGERLRSYDYFWNLTDNSGMRLQPGVYNCRITVWINDGEEIINKKITVLKQ